MTATVLLGKALADPTRVRILRALMTSSMCPCELSDALEQKMSTLSSHLQIIRQAGLVEVTRKEKWSNYSLADGAHDLLTDVFRRDAPALEADSRLQRDRRLLDERLALRQDGKCCVGPGAFGNRRKEECCP